MLFNDLVDRFFSISRELQYLVEKKMDSKRKQELLISWDYRLFNLCEYMCYLGNRDRRIRKHLIEFFPETLKMWYDEQAMKGYKKNGKIQGYKEVEKLNEWKRFIDEYIKEKK